MRLNFNNKLKFYLPFFLLLFFTNSFFSQQKTDNSNGTDWKIYYKDSCIQINYRYENCNMIKDGINKEEVYLQIKNLSKNQIDLAWELELKYGDRCFNCYGENEELKFATVLEPDGLIEGACGERNELHLKIFSKFLNSESESKLSDFKIKNLKAKTN